MTDPFADLERELLSAHARDSRARRGLLAAPRVLAMAASLVAVAGVLVWLGGSAAEDPERAASQQHGEQPGVTPVDGCAGAGWVAPQSDAPVPPAIKENIGAFEVPMRDIDPPDPHMTGRQAAKLYADGRRSLPPERGRTVHLVAAEILPRAQVDRQDDPCAAPRGELEPGVCLVLTDADGSMSACFTVGEILGGQAYLDTDRELIGIAPDGFARARAGDAAGPISENVFRIPQPQRWEPHARVDFERS